jgi:hypothetical protein
MSKDELSKTLEKLHQELAQNPPLDESTLQSMRAIAEEIQSAIARMSTNPATPQSEPPTITDRLREMISEFEARHPQLTSTMSQIADRLTDMGI